ncbi:nitroreductase family protein [Streptomyces sp. NPDC001880]
MTTHTSTAEAALAGPGDGHGHDCRPRLRRGIAVTAVARGLVVEAVGRRHLFAGAAAADTLPRLLALLDGTRDRAAIAAELGLDASGIAPVLTALEERALLEPDCSAVGTAPADGAPTAIGPVADFLSRTGPPADAEGGSSIALARLAAATVALSGPPEVTRRVTEDLRACGVGRIATVPPGEAAPVGPVDLFVVCDDASARLDEAGRAGAAGGFEVLRYAIRDSADATAAIEIGPRFLPGHTACTSCFRAGHEQAFPADRVPSPLPPATVDPVAGLVADQVTAVLAGTAQPLPRRDLRRLTVPDLTTRTLAVVPEPGCPHCGPIGAGAEREPDTAEWLLQAAPAERFAAGMGVTPFEPPVVPELETSPRYPLPAPVTAACSPGVLDEQAVSVLLSLTAGLRGTGPAGGTPEEAGPGGGLRRRWAPSGGNLGSVRIFLLTEAPLSPLPGTVFAYDGEAGELIAARCDTPPLSELLAGTALAGRPVDAALVFTGALHRLRGKYRVFSPRLAHLDTGCAMAQAALLAAELGLRADLVAGDTGGLVEHLDLDPADRLVTGIIGIYGKDTGDAARRRA